MGMKGGGKSWEGSQQELEVKFYILLFPLYLNLHNGCKWYLFLLCGNVEFLLTITIFLRRPKRGYKKVY